MSRLRRFGAFWYDFVVGDDWRVALGVVVALAATYGLSRTSIAAWWVVPVAVAVLLPMTVWREVRAVKAARRPATEPAPAQTSNVPPARQ